MIRYYLDSCSQLQAAQYRHEALARLKGRGPWKFTDDRGGVMLQRGEAVAWGPIKQGLGGLRYQLADPLPPFAQAVKVAVRGPAPVGWVDLPGGIRIPVPLTPYAEVAIGLDGKPEGVCSDFGLLAASLFDRRERGDFPVADPELVEFCRVALMEHTDLTAELVHAYNLITTRTTPLIFDAATGCDPKKADPPGGGG
jgi:hypothetical protein